MLTEFNVLPIKKNNKTPITFKNTMPIALMNNFFFWLMISFASITWANPAANEPIFPPEPEKEEGWKPLAKILRYLTPKADTSLPLSGHQINQRILDLIQNGEPDEALAAIKRREKQLSEILPVGADIQLLFLKARAYSALGDTDKTIALYQDMTTKYPELPEPWNNLAVEYVQQGKIDMALEAIEMALISDPNDKTARQNLGEIQLMLAEQAFEQAGTAGKTRAERIQQLLQETN